MKRTSLLSPYLKRSLVGKTVKRISGRDSPFDGAGMLLGETYEVRSAKSGKLWFRGLYAWYEAENFELVKD